jgi:ribose transport system permease protein
MSAAVEAVGRARPSFAETLGDWARRNRWTLGLVALLVGFLVFTTLIGPGYGAPEVQNLAIGALPIAFAAVAQAIVVISGGIDLSVGSMMALTSVTSAVLMKDQGEGFAVAVVLGVLLLGLVLGAVNGSVIVITRVPDIVVTLAMSFVWAGATLLVLDSPGGGAADWFKGLISGSIGSEWVPRALVVLVVAVGVIWIPLRRSVLGLSLYAIGSNRLSAFRSGVAVGRTKIIAYSLTGLFCALGGLAVTASTGSGSPVPGAYTLQSVAAIVLGGVSLAGGRGGILGPILAVFILQLVRTDLTFLEVNPNFSTVIQGAILIGVVLLGSVLAMRRVRT